MNIGLGMLLTQSIGSVLSLAGCLLHWSHGDGCVFLPLLVRFLARSLKLCQIFWFPLILEGFLSVLALALFRNTTSTKRESLDLKNMVERLNPLSTFLSVAGLILLIYALTEGNQIGWGSGAVIGTLVTAVVSLIAFGMVEAKYTSHPFMPPHLWKSSAVPLGCVLAAITYAVWQGANYFLTLLLQGEAENETFCCRTKANSEYQTWVSTHYRRQSDSCPLESRLFWST